MHIIRTKIPCTDATAVLEVILDQIGEDYRRGLKSLPHGVFDKLVQGKIIRWSDERRDWELGEGADGRDLIEIPHELGYGIVLIDDSYELCALKIYLISSDCPKHVERAVRALREVLSIVERVGWDP